MLLLGRFEFIILEVEGVDGILEYALCWGSGGGSDGNEMDGVLAPDNFAEFVDADRCTGELSPAPSVCLRCLQAPCVRTAQYIHK